MGAMPAVRKVPANGANSCCTLCKWRDRSGTQARFPSWKSQDSYMNMRLGSHWILGCVSKTGKGHMWHVLGVAGSRLRGKLHGCSCSGARKGFKHQACRCAPKSRYWTPRRPLGEKCQYFPRTPPRAWQTWTVLRIRRSQQKPTQLTQLEN